MKLTKDVLYLLDKINESGFEGYIVGGCVRDYLMGLTPHDYDITTNALPEDIKKIFPHTFDTGIQHGTVTVVHNSVNYEVTTYRIDGKYKDNRHPDEVTFTDDITKDLSRRDFTMNAIAYSPDKGYADPFGGREDIKKGIIRGVREPNLRFREDALRMLRALRFSAQLGFEIEEKTYEAVKNNAGLIKNVSIERITTEFLRLITSEHREKLLLIDETKLFEECAPEISRALRQRGKQIAEILKKADKGEDIALCIILAYEENPERTLKNLKLSNSLIKSALSLIKYYDFKIDGSEYDLRKLLSEMGKEGLLKLLNIKKAKGEEYISEAEKFIKNEEQTTIKSLDINGRDITGLGFKGPEIGYTLNRLLDFVLLNPENNKKEILLKEAFKWLH
ncbi:MAG: CCA tRNA nucleotidyltransferase [Clostridiales bacterium]|nr:CCA tRNA nucleotidyltransferase [Clostridiales bacterium]